MNGVAAPVLLQSSLDPAQAEIQIDPVTADVSSTPPKSTRKIFSWSIHNKLLLAFTLMCAITGALGFWCVSEIDLLSQIDTDTYDRPLMAINYARSADTTFERLSNEALWATLTPNVGDDEDPVSDYFGDLDVAEARASSQAAIVDVRKIRDLSHRWIDLRQKKTDPAGVAQLSAQIRDAFERLVEQVATDGFHQRKSATAATQYAHQMGIVLTCVALGLSLLLTLTLARRVVLPLASATAVADRIAAGQLETPIPDGGSDEAGRLLASMAFMQQRIREMMEREASRRRSAQGRLIEALESSTEAMLLLDPNGLILIANSRGINLLDILSAKPKDGATFYEIFPPDSEWPVRISTPGEVQIPNGDWLHVSREETAEGGSFLILSDITLRKEYENQLEKAAYTDPLTSVKNRTYLFSHLDGHARTEGKITDCAIIVINIDRFKRLNSMHGARICDEILKIIALRLQPLLADGDILARINGDEFALWIAQADASAVYGKSSEVQAALSDPFEIDGISIPLRVSIGGAVWDAETEHGQELLRDARVALEQVKRLGGGSSDLFDYALRHQSRIDHRIEADLPMAIREKHLYLDYQPLIHLPTGKIGGFEALVRWKHAELGQIAPMRFVTIAEESGAIVDLGQFVLNEAARQGAVWFDDGQVQDKFTIAVNLSPRQIANVRHARQLMDFLDRQGSMAKRLKLEITESVLLEDPTAMIELLNEFKTYGVELSLDDFGTGYSSLSYLHKFPFDVLKIDRSFVKDIAEETDAMRLVRTIMELGHDLGLRIVAEGIETEGQALRLRDLGCDFGQGYYFSRPIDKTAATAFLIDDRVWA